MLIIDIVQSVSSNFVGKKKEYSYESTLKYVCAHVCSSVCSSVGACACQRLTSGFFLDCFLLCFWDFKFIYLFFNWICSSLFWLYYLARHPRALPVSASQPWNYKPVYYTRLSHVNSGVQTQVFMLAQQGLYQLSGFSSPSENCAGCLLFCQARAVALNLPNSETL